MSSGRHSVNSQSRNSKNDSTFKKYRPLVPESLSDAALHGLVQRYDSSDTALAEAIQALWDKEAENQTTEHEFSVVEKKSKKKDAPVPPRQERAGRGDRGGRGGRGPRVSRPAAPAQERHSSDVQLKSNNAIQKSNDIPESLNTDDSFPVVNNRESLSVTAHLNVPQTTAASMNSVWGGGSSLAQKIKTAEKMKVLPVAADQDLKLPAESSSIDALESIGAKPAPKSRSRKDKKGQTGGKPPVKSESDIEIRAVDVSLTQQSSHSAEQETAVAAIEPPATSPVEELVSNPIALEHVSLTVPKEQAENKIENYPNSTTKFVDLGKWATSLEPANDSGFQFGSFGGEVSSASAVSRSPARISTAERNQKPFSKNASWKSEHNKKNASVSQQSNNDSRHGSVESSWAAGSIETGSFDNAGAVFSGVKSEGRRSADTASANRVPGTENGTAAVAPPGLVASQNLDSNRSSSSAHNSSNSGQKGNNSRKYQDSEQSGKQSSQSNAPPGINIRAQNSGNGFSNVMPVGVVPNMPYVNVPYDGSHQAPSLHPVSSYGVMQANFTSAAGALPAVPPSNASAVGTASSASLVQQAVPGAGGSANASANPHQPSYQSAPPGMTYMTSYPYNPPYYGHQFYYTGQPQAYYGRGQPMYQQPPRSMYGGDGYGSGGHGIGGYPDMYGSPGAQFGDSQYSGSSVHHHGQVGHGSASGPERGGKQKNAVSSNGSSQQSGMPSVESHHISYPGYGSSYSGRDVQPQYQYQGGWNPNPVIYPPSTVQGNVGPAGVFQGAGGRAHENASKSSSGYSGSQYVGGARGGSGSATVGNNPSQSGSAAPGSSLQSGGW